MSLSFRRHEQAKGRADLLALVRACNLKKMAPKKFMVAKIPAEVDRYLYWLVFEKPAKVIDCNFDEWTIDIRMRLSLKTEDDYLPECSGWAVVRYNILFEGVKNEVQLRGARIQEMDFAHKLIPGLQKGMKKKAGKLNITIPAGECY